MDIEIDKLSIYGFGSFFNKRSECQDIDILIIHQSISYQSCQFAIRCKKRLQELMSELDITILSESEEHQLSFIKKSKTVSIGRIDGNSALIDLDVIFEELIRFKAECVITR